MSIPTMTASICLMMVLIFAAVSAGAADITRKTVRKIAREEIAKVTQLAGPPGPQGPTGTAGPAGPPGTQGIAGQPGAAGAGIPIRFAHVNSDGSIDRAHGITQANVFRDDRDDESGGGSLTVYCITGLSHVRGAQVTLDLIGRGDHNSTPYLVLQDPGPPGCEHVVGISDGRGDAVPGAFYLLMY